MLYAVHPIFMSPFLPPLVLVEADAGGDAGS